MKCTSLGCHCCVELPSESQLSDDLGAEIQGEAPRGKSCRVGLPEVGQENARQGGVLVSTDSSYAGDRMGWGRFRSGFTNCED